MHVKAIAITQPIPLELQGLTPEGLMIYIARVSSGQQDNPDYVGLLKYCMREGHVSVFDQVDLTVEITTSRAIAAQILRHWSARFQEFSQRYAAAEGYEEVHPRRQAQKNRQSSTDDLDPVIMDWFTENFERISGEAFEFYREALEKGVAKESARFILPLATTTRLYMKTSVRNWIFYLRLRIDEHAQKEHQDVANEILKIFLEHFPVTAEAAGLI